MYNAEIKVLEKTSSGARLMSLKGKIISEKENCIKIGGYIIDKKDIVKMKYID